MFKNLRQALLSLFCAACFAPGASIAHDYSYQKLEIDHPYAVIDAKDSKVVNVYFRKFNNLSEESYRLLGAQTKVASKVELQAEVHNADHVASWVTIQSIDIKPNAKLLFRHDNEQGFQIKLSDLKQTIQTGDRFTLDLLFDGDSVPVNVWVQQPRELKKHNH
jgi:copper(I)-binding protein